MPVFNFHSIKKAQTNMGMDPNAGLDPNMGLDPSMGDDTNIVPEQEQKYTLDSLIAALNNDPFTAMNDLRNLVPTSENQEILDPDKWNGAGDTEKGIIAGQIMDMLPNHAKAENTMNNEESTEVPAIQKTVDIAAMVEEANKSIKKLAEDMAAKKVACACSKTFNLKKTAQSRVGQHSVLFGPDSTVLTPSINNVMNGWDILERNKAWGKRVDDMYGIDYEMVWRQNIMDKYHAEWMDKDGKWNGGYIRKRFEVDSNIPEMNNMQLKPGERRKPYVPAQGLTEARLETARGGTVFNWKKASSENLKKKLT